MIGNTVPITKSALIVMVKNISIASNIYLVKSIKDR